MVNSSERDYRPRLTNVQERELRTRVDEIISSMTPQPWEQLLAMQLYASARIRSFGAPGNTQRKAAFYVALKHGIDLLHQLDPSGEASFIRKVEEAADAVMGTPTVRRDDSPDIWTYKTPQNY